MHDRQLPPQNLEAEMSVLGAVFLDNPCLRKVSGMVDPLDFYRESHRLILKAMLHHQVKKQPIDLVTICKTLKDHGKLEEVGGAAYIANLVDYTPTSANVEHYCKIVREMALRRRLILHGRKIQEAAYGSEPVGDIIPDAKSELSEITASMDSFGGVTASDLSTVSMRAEIYKGLAKTFSETRFLTEYHLIDQKIRGVAPGEVMTVIAEPGGFKTAFLQNLLRRAKIRTGRESLFFSLEMPAEKLYEREVQITSGCSGRAVEKHFQGQGQYDVELPDPDKSMIVCAKPRLTLEKMERYIEMTRQKYGDIGVIGIDFLQLMPGPGKIFERIEHNAYGIKELAGVAKVPIILLSQINVVGRKEKAGINFYDAKGGGAIEEAADFGLGFYNDKAGNLVCEGLKNRNGPIGWKLEVEINRVSFRFVEFHEYQEVKAKAKDDEACPY